MLTYDEGSYSQRDHAVMSIQEETELMARMEGSGAAPPPSVPEGAVSKPAQQGRTLANGAAVKKAPASIAEAQTPAYDTGQGEDLVRRLTQVFIADLNPVSWLQFACVVVGPQSQ